MDELTPDSAEIRRLLDEAGAGNHRAFGELFTRHRPELRRFIERRLDPAMHSRVDASDVVQETQLEAFRRLPEFLRRQPMPFHLRVVKSRCNFFQRKSQIGPR